MQKHPLSNMQTVRIPELNTTDGTDSVSHAPADRMADRGLDAIPLLHCMTPATVFMLAQQDQVKPQDVAHHADL